jgi:hypothetical protein
MQLVNIQPHSDTPPGTFPLFSMSSKLNRVPSLIPVAYSAPLQAQPPSRKSKGGSSSASKRKTKSEMEDIKPKRPLSAYNLFFRDERARLLGMLDTAQCQDTSDAVVMMDPRGMSANGGFRSCSIGSIGDESHSKKRRKPHGLVSFDNLGKTIASLWHNIDPQQLAMYEALALQDKERYELEMAWYRHLKRMRESEEQPKGAAGGNKPRSENH